MTMGMYRDPETEEDFAYVKNFRNMIQGELSEFLDCELHVHRSGAFLILGEDCRMGRCFPEENTLSDIVLLVNSLIGEKNQEGKIVPGAGSSGKKRRKTGRRMVWFLKGAGSEDRRQRI